MKTAAFMCIVLHLGFCCAAVITEEEIEPVHPVIDAHHNKDDCRCPKFPRPADCSEVLANGQNVSGVYTIYPKSRAVDCESLQVYCDMDTDGGGWTVIQRRGDFKNGQDYFRKNWNSYKIGFGNLNKEFWLGNDNIHALTNQDSYSARFDLRTVAGKTGFSLYDTFYIHEERDNYRVRLWEYSGTAGGAISNHDGTSFYTLDRPNWPAGRKNGDKMHQGGWWHNALPSTNLNGLNKQGRDKKGEENGIVWFCFGECGFNESLGFTEIKLRPKRFSRL